ncbi:MAG TPA: DUF4097 family beta strand repeat-containing protein [Terriglobales bacterium]|nr:DUF4097 family beta strand repeat-containing protein [Terriglobales bacterium]
MITTLRRNSSCPRSVEDAPSPRRTVWFVIIAFALLIRVPASLAQVTAEFHRTFTVAPVQPLTLHVEVSEGDLQIFYGRDGQVSIIAIARTSGEARLDDNFFSKVLTIDQQENHLSLLHTSDASGPATGISVAYRIEVPYRTEVTSRLSRGHQHISGITGPVKAAVRSGDIKADYITKGVQAEVGNGDIDIQIIGDHVEAKAGTGNISCTRIPQGVNAEIGDGDITLMVVGPSSAQVKDGRGRIEVGGARGRLTGSTVGGDLHVKAIPHDDWHLSSSSGNVRLEFPPAAKLELEASTSAGVFQIDRGDIAKPGPDVHRFEREVNGGGKRVEVHTESGKIVIR